MTDEKNLSLLIGAAIFFVLGAFFVVTGLVAPAGSTQFQYQYPSLSWIVTMTPSSIGILGTGPQAQQLQVAIGIAFVVIAIILYRRA